MACPYRRRGGRYGRHASAFHTVSKDVALRPTVKPTLATALLRWRSIYPRNIPGVSFWLASICRHDSMTGIFGVLISRSPPCGRQGTLIDAEVTLMGHGAVITGASRELRGPSD